MFELLKSSHSSGLSGFALTLNNGKRIEVDFGPMSDSERKTSTRKEFEMNPKSGNAELRVYNGITIEFHTGQRTVEEVISFIANTINGV